MSIISGTLRVFEAFWHLLRWLLRHRIFGPSPKPYYYVLPTPTSSAEQNKEHVKESSNSLLIFALTIGIDNYLSQNIKNLSGCVADADDVVDFLLETLDVSPANILNLRNEEATAAGMTAAFESLATDPRIPKDAIIFIFYAGHGSEASPPEGWSFNDIKVIQTLIPYDFDFGTGENPVATNGLADIKLSQLLEDIANQKGNKITVVFDSCHSGSSTRHSSAYQSVGVASRGLDLPRGTRLGADAFPVTRGSHVLEKDKNKALGSHVLFAACTELQSALESNGRGMFTSALLRLLRSEDLKQLTYSDIIQRLPALPSQNPQCEGINKDLTFLDNTVVSRRYILHSVTQPEKDANLYVVDVGEAGGVTYGAEFIVYDTRARINELGLLIVDSVDVFESSLRPIPGDEPFDIPKNGAFAVQVFTGTPHDVRLLLESTDDNHGTLQQMLATSECKHSFKVVSTREENPDLVMTASEGTVRFQITDKICCDVGLNEIPYRPVMDSETMERILRGAADFYWNLHRTTTGAHIISPKIVLECHELQFAPFDAIESVRPIGDNLFLDGTIEVAITDEEKPYVFLLRNTSSVPLFVSAFYFNMTDLSIVPYYQPPSASHKGHFASLQPMSSLTLGYGPGGSCPQTFYLDEGQVVDVGYLKIFFTPEHVDYSHVPQESPFLPRGRVYGRCKPKQRLWDTMLIPIVRRLKTNEVKRSSYSRH